MNAGIRSAAIISSGFNASRYIDPKNWAAWYRPGKIDELKQDSAATIAAVLGQPVGYMKDASGQGHDVKQATAGSRPTLQVDIDGNYYLLFDGVDDTLNGTAFNESVTWTRISVVRQVTWVANATILGSLNTAGRLQQAGVSPQLRMFDGSANSNNISPPIGEKHVIVERHGGTTNSRIVLDNGAIVTANPGATVGSGICIGSAFGNSNFAGFALYESFAVQVQLDDSQVKAIVLDMAARYRIKTS